MTKVRVAMVGLVLVGLVGCASKPAPQLTDSAYVELAMQWATIHQCSYSNKMDLETAALGQQYTQWFLHRHTFDAARFSTEVEKLNRMQFSPTQAQCNQMAMLILEQKSNADEQSKFTAKRNAEFQQGLQDFSNSTRVKSTYCNQMGTQVLCTKY